MAHQIGIDTTTRVISQDFEYLVPATLEEALSVMDERGAGVRPLAGGTDLLIELKGDLREVDALVYIDDLDELGRIDERDRWLEIGGTVTFDQLATSPAVAEHFPILCAASRDAGGVQIEIMGTVGGNLCNASPAASSAPPLLCLDADVVLESVDGERVVPLDEFFTGVKQTVREENELLTAVRVPYSDHTGWAHEEVKRVSEDLAKAIISVVLKRDDDRVEYCRIGLGSLAPVPFRAHETEALLDGKRLDDELLAAVESAVSEEVSPITDSRSTADYRRLITGVKTRDLILNAWGAQ